MKKLTPEHDQASAFEGRLSDIISGITLLTGSVEPIHPEIGTLYYLYNYPIASKDTISWILKASLEDDEYNRIGISTYQENNMICGKTFRSVKQQINITAKNESSDSLFKHNTVFNCGIHINPRKRRVAQLNDENRGYFDFKSNPLTNRFGFNTNMTNIEMLSCFNRVINAALQKELIIKAEF